MTIQMFINLLAIAVLVLAIFLQAALYRDHMKRQKHWDEHRKHMDDLWARLKEEREARGE